MSGDDEMYDTFFKNVPEAKEIFEFRYRMVELIREHPGIGRRSLSDMLQVPERKARGEIKNLETLKLVKSTSKGLKITPTGNNFISELGFIYPHHNSLADIEQHLAEVLGISKVIVARDDINLEKNLLKRGKDELRKLIKSSEVLGVCGGSSVRLVIDHFNTKKNYDIDVVPAQGDLGQPMEEQANTLAYHLAQRINGRYHPLYVSDSLEPEAMSVMREEPRIKGTLSKIENIDTLVFGVGIPKAMIRRRQLRENLHEDLLEKGVKGEAFGCFFDGDGKLIYQVPTLGVSLEKVKQLEGLLCIAFGEDKAEAVLSVVPINKKIVLLTDESCALKMRDLIGGKNGKSST